MLLLLRPLRCKNSLSGDGHRYPALKETRVCGSWDPLPHPTGCVCCPPLPVFLLLRCKPLAFLGCSSQGEWLVPLWSVFVWEGVRLCEPSRMSLAVAQPSHPWAAVGSAGAAWNHRADKMPLLPLAWIRVCLIPVPGLVCQLSRGYSQGVSVLQAAQGKGAVTILGSAQK